MTDLSAEYMKAAIYDHCGPPDVLRYEDVAMPAMTATDVRIRVQAVSVEGGDLRKRRSVPPPGPKHVVGYQAAGIVEAIGSEVRTLRVGDRVAAFNWTGSHAEYFVVPEHFAYPVPDELDIRIAATIPVTTGTADDALFEIGRAQPGETVLLHGATGGVGLAAIQLGAQAGLRMIATASRTESYQYLRDLGADAVINHASENVTARARELTSERGVDLVVDFAGGKAAPTLLQALRYRGRICLVGVASGFEGSYSFRELSPNALSLHGVSFGREMHLPRVREMLQRHFSAVAQGKLRVSIAAEFALRNAAKAHAHAETERAFGRVVMVP